GRALAKLTRCPSRRNPSSGPASAAAMGGPTGSPVTRSTTWVVRSWPSIAANRPEASKVTHRDGASARNEDRRIGAGDPLTDAARASTRHVAITPGGPGRSPRGNRDFHPAGAGRATAARATPCAAPSTPAASGGRGDEAGTQAGRRGRRRLGRQPGRAGPRPGGRLPPRGHRRGGLRVRGADVLLALPLPGPPDPAGAGGGGGPARRRVGGAGGHRRARRRGLTDAAGDGSRPPRPGDGSAARGRRGTR